MEKFHSHALRLRIILTASKIDSFNRLISLFLSYDSLRKLQCMLKLDEQLLQCRKQLDSLVREFIVKYADMGYRFNLVSGADCYNAI
ncbi:MAG: hypothetical protein NC110_06455 [Ruminococcus sp.]|nr:hypothetical protein [Ruminococcus sp.]